MSNEDINVRKTVFVPATLWHRIKVDAVQQGIEISEIVVEALKEYYALKTGQGSGEGLRADGSTQV